MSNHSFDVHVATEYRSVDLAILVWNFQYWISLNKRLKRNQHEGRTWTYQTVRELRAIFPYWSIQQIDRLIKKAVDHKILIKGNFNKSKFDRTMWYAFQNEEKFMISRNSEMEIPEPGNPNTDTEEPIPDTIPNTKPDREVRLVLPHNLTSFFYDQLKIINPEISKPNLKAWAKEFELIMRVDGRSEENIRKVINFLVKDKDRSAAKNGFKWSNVVLSPNSLRKNYAQIWAQMGEQSPSLSPEEKSQRIQKNRETADQIEERLKDQFNGRVFFTANPEMCTLVNANKDLTKKYMYDSMEPGQFLKEVVKELENNFRDVKIILKGQKKK